MKVSPTFVALGLVVGAALSLSGARVAAAAEPAFDPTNFSGHAIDNTWFPLTPGTTLVYKGTKDGKNATDVFHVTQRTRAVDGVGCHRC